MSSTTSEIGKQAEAAALDAVWSQWGALTPAAATTSAGAAWTLIDPEALILASLALMPVEQRLGDLVAAWAREAGFLMSKSRFRSMEDWFPAGVEFGVADFAYHAAEAGHSNWKGLAPAEAAYEPRGKRVGPLNLTLGPALILRLRAGFGVNAKADLLATLLGMHGTVADLKLMTAATGYTERAIRNATEEMVIAGLITEITGRPSAYRVDHKPWADLLDPQGSPDQGPRIPPWRFWAAILPFLLAVHRWGEEAARMKWSDYVASSRARDLFERHEKRLTQAGIFLPASPQRAGEAFLEQIHTAVGAVQESLG